MKGRVIGIMRIQESPLTTFSVSDAGVPESNRSIPSVKVMTKASRVKMRCVTEKTIMNRFLFILLPIASRRDDDLDGIAVGSDTVPSRRVALQFVFAGLGKRNGPRIVLPPSAESRASCW